MMIICQALFPVDNVEIIGSDSLPCPDLPHPLSRARRAILPPLDLPELMPMHAMCMLRSANYRDYRSTLIQQALYLGTPQQHPAMYLTYWMELPRTYPETDRLTIELQPLTHFADRHDAAIRAIRPTAAPATATIHNVVDYATEVSPMEQPLLSAILCSTSERWKRIGFPGSLAGCHSPRRSRASNVPLYSRVWRITWSAVIHSQVSQYPA